MLSLVSKEQVVALVEDDDYLAWKAEAATYFVSKSAPDGFVTGIRVLHDLLVVYFQ